MFCMILREYNKRKGQNLGARRGLRGGWRGGGEYAVQLFPTLTLTPLFMN